jgi:hypothetical protein
MWKLEEPDPGPDAALCPSSQCKWARPPTRTILEPFCTNGWPASCALLFSPLLSVRRGTAHAVATHSSLLSGASGAHVPSLGSKLPASDRVTPADASSSSSSSSSSGSDAEDGEDVDLLAAAGLAGAVVGTVEDHGPAALRPFTPVPPLCARYA